MDDLDDAPPEDMPPPPLPQADDGPLANGGATDAAARSSPEVVEVQHSIHIEGIEDEEDDICLPAESNGFASQPGADGFAGDGAPLPDASDGSANAAMIAGGPSAAGGVGGAVAADPPRALKAWPLPPSLTPKKRGTSALTLVEVPLDVGAVASVAADGAWVWACDSCEARYETRTGLYAHTRFCAGRKAAWSCEWCACTEAETSHKASGPNGARTLCSACGQRWRHGAEGMPTQNRKGEWLCDKCQRAFPTMAALGGHRRFCDGGVWRCGWCECKYADANGKGPGPEGAQTLCSACSGRWRAGHSGPPPRTADGRYVCEKCSKPFDTIPGLGSHRKRCDGGNWRCGWCNCTKGETSGKGPGPDGVSTLCSICSARWRAGHKGPPQTDASGRYPCEHCQRTFESFRALGGHMRDCDGGYWRCNWCQCKAHETSGKSPGPDGPRTLCGACASRYRAGHTGPPARDESGRYICEKCSRAFDNISSLGGHQRFCDGGAWRCGWCKVGRDECSGKGPGPDGGGTLCSLCSNRWKSGHKGPPPTDADGRYPCEMCQRTFESFRALGVHTRDCDGGKWQCNWCQCKADETSGKSPGPDGPRTLCANCGSRWRSGAQGPAKVDQFGQYPCDTCGRSFDSMSGLGVHKRRCGVAAT